MTVNRRNVGPVRMEALTSLHLEGVPDELEAEVGAVVDRYTRGWAPPWASPKDFAGSLGRALLRRLEVAPGFAVGLHPAVPYGEVRPWRDDGSGLPEDHPRVRFRRDACVLCGVLVLACVLAERRGTPVPPELLAASTRLLSGGHVEVLW